MKKTGCRTALSKDGGGFLCGECVGGIASIWFLGRVWSRFEVLCCELIEGVGIEFVVRRS